MDNYKLLVNGFDITGRVGGLSSTEDIDALSVQLSFTVVKNPHDTYIPAFTLAPGDKIQLFNNQSLVFRGIVIKTGLDGSVQANDFGYYLNKSKIILQCNGVPADEGIRQLGAKAGVSVGSLPSMPTKITEIFVDKTPAEILKSILETVTAERGTKYFYRVEPDSGLCIYPYPSTPIKLRVQLARNLRTFDPTWSLGDVSGEDSMDGLCNQVTIYRTEDENARVLAKATDSASISKYGWIQHMESADEGVTAAQARQMAQTKLAELNQLTVTRKVDNMLGADVRAGEMLQFSSDKFGLSGNWMIKQITHNYDSTHTMSMEVIQP